MITREEFENAVGIINTYKIQVETELSIINKSLINIKDIKPVNKETFLMDTNLSVRALNCLKANRLFDNFWEIRVSDLKKHSRNELLKFKNMGAKSMREIDLLCYSSGVKMKP